MLTGLEVSAVLGNSQFVTFIGEILTFVITVRAPKPLIEAKWPDTLAGLSLPSFLKGYRKKKGTAQYLQGPEWKEVLTGHCKPHLSKCTSAPNWCTMSKP